VHRHDRMRGEGEPLGDPVATFANLPDAIGARLLSSILPVLKAAERAAGTVKAAPDPFRQALTALANAVIDPLRKDSRR
jgi:hypothetical protein